MSEHGKIKDEIAEPKSSAVMLGQAEGNDEQIAAISIHPEPEMSDHMIPVGSNSPLGRTHISQESGVGENSSTHDFDVKVGISRRLQFENENRADFSFQQPSGNAADFLGFTDSPYMSSTLFSPKHSERRSAQTLSDVFPQRMESASKVSDESVRGSFDEVERKSASTISSDLHRNYAEFAESPQSMKPLLEPVTLNPEMLFQSKFSDKRKWNSETIDTFGNFVPSTAKKKRKKTSETGEGNGCKRCNCKKTKCLKLYCDCFAAGVYCAESCACQACFNKLEYEDTVLETRQQIELRNPLAFAPKIIKNINETSSSILMDAGDFTPLSGRHKSGCNCKKSKCLKKYCECYQANVGCSDGCRCEGCENVHGRKLGYDVMKNLVGKQNISKKLDTAFGLMPSEGDFMQNQMYSPHNMAAAYTPAFQDATRNVSPWFSRERLLQAPDSDLNLMMQFEQPEDSMRNGSPWFCRLRPPDSGVNLTKQFRQVKDAEEALMDAGAFDEQGLSVYNMSNQLVSPSCDGQTWMTSNNSLRWRTSSLYGTNKLGSLEDPMYNVVANDRDDEAMSGVRVRSPKKKRISPPRSAALH